MEVVRAQAADFVGCSLQETVLFPSTTVTLNTVVEGLVSSGFISQGDEVLTSNQEHAGGVAGWKHLEKKGMITLSTVELPVPDLRSTDAVVHQFASALSSKTKVLAFSHVLTTSGQTLPVKEITAMAHSKGISVIIDGAQAFGNLVNVTDIGADVYATSAHKWLLAPTGNGIGCIRQSFSHYVNATSLDAGYGIYTRASGTRAAYTTVGLGHSLGYIDSFGRQNVAEFNVRLAKSAWQGFHDLGLAMLTRSPGPLDAPLVSFALPAPLKATAVGNQLWDDYGIVSKVTGKSLYPEEWPTGAPDQALRFSFHLFNSPT
eukprot:CAMPEP_0175127096 /NCGR_PEP_ID=MMETSP0087-20121206/4208_1 /TAXON_ID=136419 /ORGANISM="Unknown Unknown, Strain D1" /LENGTH=316 /DNA_ID=CAMNT_0016409059 /DNA_START=176 /DNA_END=1123 /DNA_ORIENTATION=+